MVDFWVVTSTADAYICIMKKKKKLSNQPTARVLSVSYTDSIFFFIQLFTTRIFVFQFNVCIHLSTFNREVCFVNKTNVDYDVFKLMKTTDDLSDPQLLHNISF